MPIPRKEGCRYEERRDADAEGCNTERPGRKILRGSDADADAERERCRRRRLPGKNAYNTTTISVTGYAV